MPNQHHHHQQQQQQLSSNESRAQPSWIYDDIYNCYKVAEKLLIVRLHDNLNACWKYQQIKREENDNHQNKNETHYICMQCAASDNENDDEDYIYQSRAILDDGYVISEPHAQSCQSFSIKSKGSRTTRFSLSDNIDWHYQNTFFNFEIIDSNNNSDIPESIQVFNNDNCLWKFIKNDFDEFKCETCLKYGWTTYAKQVEEKIMTQSHHPLCLPLEK